MGKGLEGDNAGTADPNWPNGCPITCSIVFTNKSSGKGGTLWWWHLPSLASTVCGKHLDIHLPMGAYVLSLYFIVWLACKSCLIELSISRSMSLLPSDYFLSLPWERGESLRLAGCLAAAQGYPNLSTQLKYTFIILAKTLVGRNVPCRCVHIRIWVFVPFCAWTHHPSVQFPPTVFRLLFLPSPWSG